jgi:phosphate transport system substrate-binding protein
MIKYFAMRAIQFVSVSCLVVCSQVGLGQVQVSPASNTKPANQNAGPLTTTPAAHSDLEHAALTHLVDSIEPYLKKKELKGSAVLSGSSTMIELGRAWAERFKKFHPDVVFTRGADGSEAGIKALSEDPNVIAGSSRPLTDADIALLKKGKCKDPLAVIVALDPLALYVNKENPIVGVTPEQLESIFRAPGGKGKHAGTWGEIGVTGEWATKPIRIHARSETSGTTTFIKQLVLQNGEMAKEAKSHKTNDDICAEIATDKQGVGICGFGDGTPSVKAIPMILNGVSVPATEQSFLAGNYPFVRPLELVIDKAQMATDGGLREAMLRYILSRDGQLEAVRAGFFPMDPAFIRQQLDQISGPQFR